MTFPRPSRAPLTARVAVGLAVVLLVSSAFAAETPAGARGEGGMDAGEARVAAELLVDAAAVRPGETVRVGVLFTLDPGWHIYWRNAGDSGKPTELTWRAGSAEIGPTQWPAPRVFREGDGLLTTFGYDGDVLLASDAVIGADARGGLRFEVDAAFVTCKVVCIPGRMALAREVPVTPDGALPTSAVRARFDLAASRLPHAAEALGIVVAARPSQSAVRPGDEFLVALDVASCAQGGDDCTPWTLAATRADEAFLPEAAPGLRLEPAGLGRAPVSARAGGFSLLLAGRAWEDPGVELQRLRGVVPLVRAGRSAHLAVDVPLVRAPAGAEVAMASAAAFEVVDPLAAPPEAAAAAAGPGVGALSLGVALGLALLGGLVLNLMPCVLPVLALKVFGVAELAHEERGRMVRHGLAYLGGVLVSMAALAAAVVALRAAGTSVGWGFQFQEPAFVAAICTLLVVFAMNLFGVFEVTLQPSGPELQPRAGSPAPQRSFFEGTLAVALATPCTAPFLGTAVGFAFAGSNAVIFGIFAAIGVGLAAPYLLVTLVPGWARFVPRPGAWMLRVRAALGFSLLAAVVWLLWVAGRALGVDAQAVLLAHLVVIAFLLWILGGLQAAARPVATRALAAGIAGFVVLSLGVLPLEPKPRAALPAAAGASGAAIDWRPWDRSAIARERAAGRPVFVDFTADWCITCKVNESVVLANGDVRGELARWNYATFKADWTLHDEAIGRQLAAWGRAGVPMYLVYPADPTEEAKLLPELLTVGGTIEALRATGRR
jgi:thiol:disulfide interchange protein DsbD